MTPPPDAATEHTSADRSVRLAWPDDSRAIAQLQVDSWGDAFATLPPVEAVAEAWHRSLVAPGDARNRVLVALERNSVRGFIVCRPASDPDSDQVADAELSDLTVGADARGHGHGSRLLHAAADTLRADRFARAVYWLRADDDGLRAFLGDMGWGPDGAHRELGQDAPGADTVRQVRLHTALS